MKIARRRGPKKAIDSKVARDNPEKQPQRTQPRGSHLQCSKSNSSPGPESHQQQDRCSAEKA